MAWRREEAIQVAGARVAGHVRERPDAGEVEITIPWRPGVTPGGIAALGGRPLRIVAVRDPGGRHEILELLTRPVAGALAARGGRPRSRRERLAAIRAALAELDPADPAHMTADGRPDATVLSERLGWRVTARERDEASGSAR